MFLLTPIPLPVADLLFAFRESNLLSGKLIVAILFLGSMFAWSVMVTKAWSLKRARDASRRFVTAFRSERHPLTLFLRRQEYPESPLFRVYLSACSSVSQELEAHGDESAELLLGRVDASRHKLSPYQIAAVRNAAERTIADQALELEERMGFLATAVSASPLLGLLGTVWGVMDTFTSMALSGAASLASVAPGVSGALLTTVMALIVAIPSAIGYNILTAQIRQLGVQMDNLADEFIESLQRSFLET